MKLVRSPKVLIVADDLTGALDAASPFSERGYTVKSVVDPNCDCPLEDLRDADVVALNTNSRHLSADAVKHNVEAALATIDLKDYSFFVKKIDSTLRGNVCAETLVLMDVLGKSSAVVCPALPDHQRVVKGGYVYVNDVRLDRTEFCRDKLSPAPSTSIAKAFRAFNKDINVNHSKYLEDELSPGITVFDAQNNETLADIVRLFNRDVAQTILVGSSGITAQLAMVLPKKSMIEGASLTKKTILFSVGSRASRSSDQIRNIEKRMPGVAHVAVNGTLKETPKFVNDVFVVFAGSDPKILLEPQEVAVKMAETTSSLVEELDPDVLLVTGGDTALSFLRKAKISSVTVRGNLFPGVPLLVVFVGGRRRVLVTKAGGFGAKTFFLDIIDKIRSESIRL